MAQINVPDQYKDKIPVRVLELMTELYNGANLTNQKLIDELLRTMFATMVKAETAPVMSVESMVASRTKEPVAVFTWGAMRGELSPIMARGYAMQILEAAEAATQDAALYHGMTEVLGSSPDDAFRMITLVRDQRRKYEGGGGE